MGRSLNSVCLSGYLGRKPELAMMPSGDAASTLRLAVTISKVDESGDWIEDTMWLDVRTYGKRAEVCAEYLDKGSFIMVDGQLLPPRSWTDDEGNYHISQQIRANNVIFGPRTGEQTNEGGFAKSNDSDDSDIPF